jgi:hypothetical protein
MAPDPDLDPALFSIYGSGSRSGSGSWLFDDIKIKIKKIKKDFCLFHISFDYEGIPYKEMKKIGKKFIKCLKILNLWSVFKLLDPDPYIIYRSGSGSRRANNIRIRLDPDPQHCF